MTTQSLRDLARQVRQDAIEAAKASFPEEPTKDQLDERLQMMLGWHAAAAIDRMADQCIDGTPLTNLHASIVCNPAALAKEIHADALAGPEEIADAIATGMVAREAVLRRELAQARNGLPPVMCFECEGPLAGAYCPTCNPPVHPELPAALRPPATVGKVTAWGFAGEDTAGRLKANEALLMMQDGRQWFARIQFCGELFAGYQKAVAKLWAAVVSEDPDDGMPEATEADFDQMTVKTLQPVETMRAVMAALEPFAKMADSYDPVEDGEENLKAWFERPTIGQLRAAREAHKALLGGKQAMVPMRIMDAGRPMEADATKATAAEAVLCWLLAEYCDGDDGRAYTPKEAGEIIERRLKREAE